jgi:hypothetical protein
VIQDWCRASVLSDAHVYPNQYVTPKNRQKIKMLVISVVLLTTIGIAFLSFLNSQT